MHKYTKEGGGNQDSQYKEMVELMKRFLQCRDRDITLLIIVDGDYYQKNEETRLNELKHNQRYTPPKSYALSIGELPALIHHYERG